MKTWVILSYIGFVVFLLLLLTLGHLGNELGGMASVRWIHDTNELFVYFDRSAWWGGGSIPYTSTSLQEYPQLALLLLTVPKMLGAGDAPAYFAGFFLLELLFLVLFFWVGSRILNVFNRSQWMLALWFLPGLLYFSFNRFDLWMVAFVLASVLALWKDRDRSALFLLGLATMIKWVPLLLVPLYLLYLKKEQRNWVKPLFFFGLALTPLLLWTGLQAGWQGLWFSFGLHLGRGIGDGSVWNVVMKAIGLHPGFGVQRLFLWGAWVLQLFFPIVTMFIFVRTFFIKKTTFWIEHFFSSREGWLFFCAVSLTAFAIFNRFYSPQWWLWSAALLLPILKQRNEFALFIILDLLHYLIFPLAFDWFGPDYFLSSLLHMARLVLTVLLLIVIFKRLQRDFAARKTFLQLPARPVSMGRDA